MVLDTMMLLYIIWDSSKSNRDVSEQFDEALRWLNSHCIAVM